MGKRGGYTNAGKGVIGKKARTTSHDAGGKFVSENSCIRSLSEDASIKQTWLGTSNLWKQFPMSSAQLDPLTEMLSFCDNKQFPSS
jgi:hypothetical protein